MNPWTHDFSPWVCVGNQDVSNYHIGHQEILITVHLNPLKLKIKNTLYSNRGFFFFFFLLKRRSDSVNQMSTFRTHGDYCFKGPGGVDKNPSALSVLTVPWYIDALCDCWSMTYFSLKAVYLKSVLSSSAQLSEHVFFSVLLLELTLRMENLWQNSILSSTQGLKVMINWQILASRKKKKTNTPRH